MAGSFFIILFYFSGIGSQPDRPGDADDHGQCLRLPDGVYRGELAKSPRPDLGPDGDQCDAYAIGGDDYGAIKGGSVLIFPPPG